MKKLNRIKRFLPALFCFIVFSLTSRNVCAQEASGSDQLGLRLGGYSGLTFRHFTSHDLGIELDAMGFIPAQNLLVDGLIEKNFPVGDGFNIYVGGGGFIGASPVHYYRINHIDYIVSGPYFGLELVGGLDFYFPKAPIVLGIDLRPRLFAFVYPDIFDGGLNLRYVF